MGGKIVFIIIAIVGLGLGLYLYSSGALVTGFNGFNTLVSMHPGSGSSTSNGSSSSSGSFWSFLGASNKPPVGPSFPPGEQPVITAPHTTATTTINPANIPAGFTAAQLSPYFQKVRFAGVSAASVSYYGTIRLSYSGSYNSTTTIDVTGWEIRALRGDEYVPQAVNLYDPTGLAPATDIIMKSGDTVSIYSSSAPFNLRLNECIGYVGTVAKFVPALPTSCPAVDRSQIQSLTGACQNFITSIGSCKQPNFSSPQIPNADYSCMNYLENNFTYRSCFTAHNADANFLSNQIWVWTGSNPVDRYHDTVELLDKNGLLVDIYKY